MHLFTQLAPLSVLPTNKDGNLRGDDLFHNASWFDALSGEKLGWGDLDPLDVARIRDSLPEGAGVIVLGEADSIWEAQKKGLNLRAPGREFLAEKAQVLLQRNSIVAFDDYAEEVKKDRLLRGAKLLLCEVHPREEAKKRIL